MKTIKIKHLLPALIVAGSLVSVSSFAQDRKLPDGTIIYSDGTRKLPNGTVIYKGGTVGEKGTTIALPDGSVVLPDGTRTYPQNSAARGKKYKHYKAKGLPPGQAKKIYGGSAKDYAPGQQKKVHNGKGHKH